MPLYFGSKPHSHSWVGFIQIFDCRYQAPSVRAQVVSFPYNLLMQCLGSVDLRISTTRQLSKICLQSYFLLVGFYLNSHICSLDFLERGRDSNSRLSGYEPELEPTPVTPRYEASCRIRTYTIARCLSQPKGCRSTI